MGSSLSRRRRSPTSQLPGSERYVTSSHGTYKDKSTDNQEQDGTNHTKPDLKMEETEGSEETRRGDNMASGEGEKSSGEVCVGMDEKGDSSNSYEKANSKLVPVDDIEAVSDKKSDTTEAELDEGVKDGVDNDKLEKGRTEERNEKLGEVTENEQNEKEAVAIKEKEEDEYSKEEESQDKEKEDIEKEIDNDQQKRSIVSHGVQGECYKFQNKIHLLTRH